MNKTNTSSKPNWVIVYVADRITEVRPGAKRCRVKIRECGVPVPGGRESETCRARVTD